MLKLNQCKWCDYSSIVTSNSKPLQTQHLLTYSGEKSHHVWQKPYECPQCSYSSAQSSTLKGHMNKHSAWIYFLWCYRAPCCCGPHWGCRPSTPFHMIQIWCSVLEEITAYAFDFDSSYIMLWKFVPTDNNHDICFLLAFVTFEIISTHGSFFVSIILKAKYFHLCNPTY